MKKKHGATTRTKVQLLHTPTTITMLLLLLPHMHQEVVFVTVEHGAATTNIKENKCNQKRKHDICRI